MVLHNYSCMPEAEVMAFLVENDISFFYHRHLVRFCTDEQTAADVHMATGVSVDVEDAEPVFNG